MVEGINLEDVKKYNASLKVYQEKAAQTVAGIDYNTRELTRLCAELTAEIGVQVTPENVAQIRNERVQSIQNKLSVGNDILNRIRTSEEQANGASQPVVQTMATPVPNMSAPSMAPIEPNVFQNQPMQMGVMAGVITNQPNPVFGATEPSANQFSDLGSIPPIFGK